MRETYQQDLLDYLFTRIGRDNVVNYLEDYRFKLNKRADVDDLERHMGNANRNVAAIQSPHKQRYSIIRY